MKLVIRPIRYTSRLTPMTTWAVEFGLAPCYTSDAWTVLAAGRGRLALHHVEPGDPWDGRTTLAVETDDLDALQRRWDDLAMATIRRDAHGIELLFAATPFGGHIAASELSPEPAVTPDVDLAVAPMLVTTDVPAAAEWFSAWGVEPRIMSDGGGWVDCEVADGGGLVGIHCADNLDSEPPTLPQAAGEIVELPIGLSFEHRNVEAALERAHTAGRDGAHIVDEAYGRTLMIPCPDGDLIWVNAEQTDLYGYHRN